MNFKEAAEIAARERNPILAAKIADFLRDKLDITFDQSWQIIEGWTKVSRATWNEMLCCADEGYDRRSEMNRKSDLCILNRIKR